MVHILVPSAAYVLTDHLLSCEGISCYHLLKLEKSIHIISGHSSDQYVLKPKQTSRIFSSYPMKHKVCKHNRARAKLKFYI